MKKDDNNGKDDKTEIVGEEEIIAEDQAGPMVLTLNDYEGAVLLCQDGIEVIVPTCESPEEDPNLVEDLVNTITYMLFALERDDWKAEFLTFLDQEDEKDKESTRLAELKKKRAHLKVIK
jgi:hypothetical protein